MQILRLQSKLDQKTLQKKLEDTDTVVIRCNVIESIEEIELAHYLAREAFRKKTNIAKNFKYEFLLWLSGKLDIDSAIKSMAPVDGRDFFVVIFSNEKQIPGLDAQEVPLGLKKNGDPVRLESISLSRIKN
jgi:tRNA threonylcarbamoyladenosine modification (KEOPS) complex Cgi121 subunit